MAVAQLNAISLCAGVGMLDEGVRAAFAHLGVDLRTVAYGEWEAPAVAVVVLAQRAGLLERIERMNRNSTPGVPGTAGGKHG